MRLLRIVKAQVNGMYSTGALVAFGDVLESSAINAPNYSLMLLFNDFPCNLNTMFTSEVQCFMSQC